MTGDGRTPGPGRGGQGGHEPRPRIQARELRVLERSIQGHSQREIAAEEGLTQGAVSKILSRLEQRALEELVDRVERQKARQTLRLDYLYRESLRAWAASKTDAKRRVQRKTDRGPGTPGATVVQLVVETQHGDPRYLELARKALADQRTLWGLDAPQKLDVRASQGPFDTLSDEALAAELTRQQELLAARDDAAPTPAAPNAEEGPDDDR